MALGEITPEIKKAFQLANKSPAEWRFEHALADALLSQVAARLKAEHELLKALRHAEPYRHYCDELHCPTLDADWLAEADKELTK